LPVKKAIDKVIKSSQIDEKKKEEFQRILASFDARDKSRGLD
jgi:hypothetical protein